MKKAVVLLIMVLAASLLPGCGGQAAPSGEENAGAQEAAGGEALDLSSIETLGDVFAIEGKDEYTEQRAFYEDKYIYAFAKDGVLYRVVADLPADTSEALFALEYDENYEDNEKELVKDLPVKSAENLSGQILTEDEMEALVGKTGKELFDAGWQTGMYYNLENMEFWLDYGPFAYCTHFDGAVDEKDYETFTPEEGLADMKLLDIAYEGIGDATNLE